MSNKSITRDTKLPVPGALNASINRFSADNPQARRKAAGVPAATGKRKEGENGYANGRHSTWQVVWKISRKTYFAQDR